jgi:hypothetical protein
MSRKVKNATNKREEHELGEILRFIDTADSRSLEHLQQYMDSYSEELLEMRESMAKRNARIPNTFFAQLSVAVKNPSQEEKDELKDLLHRHHTSDEPRFISFLFKFVDTIRMRGGRRTRKVVKKTVKINGGQKFRIEDASKNWTLTPRYKKWVGKLTRKSTAKRHTKAEDLCVGKDNICEGDLGIARKYMPQFIGKDDVQKFRRFIRRVYGIKSGVTRRKARELKPSQKEISRERIEDLIENENILNKVLVPLIISKDNYVVDGHHRWAAYRLKKPNKALPVVEIDAPIKDVLGISIAWGAKHQEF